MKTVKVKLIFNTELFNETATYVWDNNKLTFKHIKGTSCENNNYSSLNPEDNTFEDIDDTKMVESFLSNCCKKTLEIASNIDATIYLVKELWYYDSPAIVERWLDKDSNVMERENTKTEFYLLKDNLKEII